MISIDSLVWRFRQVIFVMVAVVCLPFGAWQLATPSASALQALLFLGFGLAGIGMAFQRRLAASPAAYAAFMIFVGVVFTFCCLAVAVGALGEVAGFDQGLFWAGAALGAVAIVIRLVRLMRA